MLSVTGIMLSSKCVLSIGLVPRLCRNASCMLSSNAALHKIDHHTQRRPVSKFLLQKGKLFELRKNWMLKRFQSSSSDDVTIVYRHGLPIISVNLPSKHEKCSFTLRPLLSTVGQFLNDLKAEDKGIETAAVYDIDGTRIASSTQIEHLLSGNFTLRINNDSYTVEPPPLEKASSEHITQFDDIKGLIGRLYNDLNVDQYCLKQEQEVLGRLEDLKTQLEPLEKVKHELEKKASFRTNLLIWGGLAYMAGQFGILARLTWWEYSWDIMEPVTYFITYGTAILMYGYFILTKQEMLYPDARDRQFLRFLHKAADSSKFDISQYNSLQSKIARAEEDLAKLREPLNAHRPIQPPQATNADDS